MNPLQNMLENRLTSRQRGICSVCSANDLVLEAALEMGRDTGTLVLIEATANQVNQFGGYTGLQPVDFLRHVEQLAERIGLPAERLILGGDHLGPLTWKNEPEESAMAKAEELIRLFVLAGFKKIHIDTSMRLGDDDPNAALPVETVAKRSARLAAAAEKAFAERKAECPGAVEPVYIVGSEVPIPGGAQEQEAVTVTSPEAFLEQVALFKATYEGNGLTEAWKRVLGVVVQPGVEFGDNDVCAYDSVKAAKLIGALPQAGGLVFEGHSTDYQTKDCLKAMVDDGVAILKVGPALTFAMREALYALEGIEREMGCAEPSDFRAVLENLMLEKPETWKKYYHGTEKEIALKRSFSYSDRCRYLMAEPVIRAAVEKLFANIDQSGYPMSLLSQYMPMQYTAVREGRCGREAAALARDRVKDCLREYWYATVR